MQNDTAALLQSFPLFKGIDFDDLNRMLKCFPPQLYSYTNKDIVVAGGSPFKAMGIIVSGKAAITRDTYSGNRVIIAVLGPGDIFGELSLSSHNKYWAVNVVTDRRCQVVFFNSEFILTRCENLCLAHSIFLTNMLEIVSHKALIFNTRLEHLAERHLRGKMSSFLMEHYWINGSATFNIPMKRHELADYLNVSRPSLSREMKLMKEDGIIDYHTSSITIKNISALERSIE